MKKITISIFALFFAGQMSFAQAVSEHAIIPVSVTLNSILRLNVVTGGNIQFVVNTITQYTAGVENTSRYTTNFTVASSTDFDVTLIAEDGTFIGSDDPGHVALTLDNVGFTIDNNAGAGTEWTLLGLTALDNTALYIVTGGAGVSAGDATQNDFNIEWELATPALRGITLLGTLLSQSIPADRYITNVFVDLLPK